MPLGIFTLFVRTTKRQFVLKAVMRGNIKKVEPEIIGHNNKKMKRILLSLSIIAFVGAIAVGATGAWFSDTEISRENRFTAGSLDIKIDNECHYWWNGALQPCPNGPTGVGHWVSTWSETDLGAIHKFFYFDDIKPGDWGENTISIHVYDNDAWGQMHLKLGPNKDNDCTEPEGETEMKGLSSTTSPVAAPGCDDDGELYQKMEFMSWLDQGRIPGFQCNNPIDLLSQIPRCPHDPWEGDNIWQDEPWITDHNSTSTPTNDPWVGRPEPMIPTEIVALDLAGLPLPPPTPPNDPNFHPSFFDVFFDIDLAMKRQIVPSPGDPDFDLCPVDGDGHYNYERCHGIAHDGRLVGSVTYYIGWMWKLPHTVGNEVQTDSLMGDMMFEATQHRNNPPAS